MIDADFHPPAALANRHLQSMLASLPPRRTWVARAARNFLARSRELIVDSGKGVRLLAEAAEPDGGSNGRLVVMIHGWEGSSDSCYMLSAAPLLLEHGYTVVRLNLRDHGDSHHLNEDIFHSCRLDEVVGAVGRLQEMWPELRLSLVGYSLGGNFALRVGVEAGRAGLDIDRIVSVCPVLDPAQTLEALDTGWSGYRHHFLRKWRRSLLKKSAVFPERYRFGRLHDFTTLEAMTDFFVTRYTEYDDLHSYLGGYALTGDRLAELAIDSTVLLADDDPVIPVRGLNDMQLPARLKVHRSLHGGHCGFVDSLRARCWLDQFILKELSL
jgi:uncharacterized protein